MVDYSRFDHIGSDSDEETPTPRVMPSSNFNTPNPAGATAVKATDVMGNSAPSSALHSGSLADTSGQGPGGGSASDKKSYTQPVMMQSSSKGKEGRIKFEYQGYIS